MNQKLDKFHKYLNLYQKLVKVNAGKFVHEQYAEDVAQETFIKMYQHLDFLEDESVKQWLIVVSGNIAKDYLRKGGKYEIHPMDPKKLEYHMEKYCESAEECYEKEHQQKAVLELCRTACNLLYEKNPTWYYIMVDSCILGMSSAQIAKALNLSPGNVNVMKKRARDYLRKVLGEEYCAFF